MLTYLVSNIGRVLTSSLILRTVWGPEYVGETQYLRNIIAALRRKIEPDSAHPVYILTDPGIGYRFRVPIDA